MPARKGNNAVRLSSTFVIVGLIGVDKMWCSEPATIVAARHQTKDEQPGGSACVRTARK